jgi:transcriptional regulator GlxA family with amidase domain
MFGLTSTRFEVTVMGVRKTVTTAQGLSVPVTPIPRKSVPDLVVIPAIGFKMPDPLVCALSGPEVQEAAAAIRSWSARGALTSAACIGTFVLAESGLLENQSATTTWWLAPLFRQRYPRVRVDESRMIVKSGHVVTAGAALSHMDLALWLIRRKSPKLATLTGKYLIVDSRPAQSAYILLDHLAHADPIVEKFENWAHGRLAKGFDLDDAARATGTSKRTLARRLKAVMGKSPLSCFQDVRVERAVHLLKTTHQSVDAIAQQVGYDDGVTLRLLLRRRLGQGVREIRKNT